MRVVRPLKSLCHTLCNANEGTKITFLGIDYGGELSVKAALFQNGTSVSANVAPSSSSAEPSPSAGAPSVLSLAVCSLQPCQQVPSLEVLVG